ncbi:GNAT family N-acetyltransferase [Streptomyces coerulescens]|uniref:GNAT family N-acetyltransferase n=1 Tax=Streptomyces coerulescens TaxID=29304 RepID=A0ABW0CW51_STRCD
MSERTTVDGPFLETERLMLRPFTEGDLDEYAAIMADPTVTRFLGSGAPLTREQAWESLALLAGHQRMRGYTQEAVVEKATGRILGRGGLWNAEGWPGLEVGWILGQAAWGHGYATELGAAWRDYAFSALDAPQLFSVIHPDNTGSIRVAERIGHRYLRDVEVTGIRCLLYGQLNPNH